MHVSKNKIKISDFFCNGTMHDLISRCMGLLCIAEVLILMMALMLPVDMGELQVQGRLYILQGPRAKL
jgi:hypothetical protein